LFINVNFDDLILQSRDTTPISEYLRLNQSQEQMLLSKYLPDSMASLKSMAQDVLDRSGLNLGEHSKFRFWVFKLVLLQCGS